MAKRYLWEEIEKNKENLSLKIMKDQYLSEGKKIDSIPSEYKEKYLQDSSYNLTFLASSLNFDNINSFKNYMKWLSDLIKNIGIPLDSMLNHFKSMDKVLNNEFNTYNLEELKRYLIEGTKVFEETWIKEDKNEIPDLNSEVELFLDYVLNFKREEAAKYVIDLLDNGKDIKEIYLEIFQPSLYQIGDLWQKQKITVAKEHYATSVIQSIIGMIYPYLFRNYNKKEKVFLGACSGSELHEIGLRMTADFLEMDGWDTHYYGANLPIEYIIQEVKEKKPDVLGISTTILLNLGYAKEMIKEIRKDPEISKTKIVVGGGVYRNNDDLWREIGADEFATDALSAVEKINLLVQRV